MFAPPYYHYLPIFFAAHEIWYEKLQELDSDLVKDLVPKVDHRVRLLKYLK